MGWCHYQLHWLDSILPWPTRHPRVDCRVVPWVCTVGVATTIGQSTCPWDCRAPQLVRHARFEYRTDSPVYHRRPEKRARRILFVVGHANRGLGHCCGCGRFPNHETGSHLRGVRPLSSNTRAVWRCVAPPFVVMCAKPISLVTTIWAFVGHT